MPEERVGFKYRLWRIVESTPFEYFIMTLIVLNTILLMMKVKIGPICNVTCRDTKGKGKLSKSCFDDLKNFYMTNCAVLLATRDIRANPALHEHGIDRHVCARSGPQNVRVRVQGKLSGKNGSSSDQGIILNNEYLLQPFCTNIFLD